MNLTTMFDQLAEAENDQTWHYVQMVELETELSRNRAAFMNSQACLENAFHVEKREWMAAQKRVAELAAEADRQIGAPIPNFSCGHPITGQQLLQHGPEAWCWICCQWRDKTGTK